MESDNLKNAFVSSNLRYEMYENCIMKTKKEWKGDDFCDGFKKNKCFIIALLICSLIMIFFFTFYEYLVNYIHFVVVLITACYILIPEYLKLPYKEKVINENKYEVTMKIKNLNDDILSQHFSEHIDFMDYGLKKLSKKLKDLETEEIQKFLKETEIKRIKNN